MRSANPRLSRLLALFLTLALLAGLMPAALADGGPDPLDPGPEPATVQSVSVSPSSTSVEKDKSISLSATLEPSGTGKEDSITWSASGTGDVSISPSSGANVTITGTKAGSVTITASVDGAQGTATVEVTEPTPPPAEVRGITLNPTSLNFTMGSDAAGKPLQATVDADSGASYNIDWSISPSGVAEISGSGDSVTVTPLKDGSATITAKISDSISATCSVKVNPAVVSDPKLPSSLSIKVNESGTVSVTDLPQGANVSWSVSGNISMSSSNASSCTVKGTAAGSGTITATITGSVSKTLTCNVTVVAAATPTLSASTLSLDVGKTTTLSVNNLPAGASVAWSPLNSNALTISGSGTSVTLRGGKLSSGRAESVTVTATITGTVNATLNCTVTVNPGKTTNLTYTVAAGEAKFLSRTDFQALCQSLYGYDLTSVTFDYAASKGTLYQSYNTTSGTGTRMTSSNCVFSTNTALNALSQVAFVPDVDATGTATVSFRLTDSGNHTQSGTITFTLTAPTGNIKYTTGRNQAVNFVEGDFYDLCKKLTGYGLDYVVFSLPASSRGTLYYNYDAKTGEYDGKLKSAEKCYYNASSRDTALGLVSFVPAKDWYGTVSISFTGYSTNSRAASFQGSVSITVSRTDAGGDVSFKTAVNTALELDDADFNSFCKDLTGTNLSYIRFTEFPSSGRGTLYYKYGRTGEKEADRNTSYYRSESPYLEDLTFVPAKDYQGTASFSFTGRSTGGTDFQGTLVIQVGSSVGDIRYETASGSNVAFRADDFNTFCKNETGANLDYVTFNYSSGRKGYLYYRYSQSNTVEVGSEKYYRSGSPALDELTFVPGSATESTVSIPFSGKNTSGKSFSGTVTITYANLKEPDVIRYSSQGSAALFRASDFSAACTSRGGKSLVSVRFTLPDSTMGRLYYDYSGPTSYRGPVLNSVDYAVSGAYLLDKVAFVPRAGYSGLVNVTYTGTDAAGITYNGTIQISVLAPTTSSRFTDMGSYSWAASAADFLYQYGITTGTTGNTYGPSLNITRGDFVLMLYRAFGFSGGTGENFADVPADSYYAQAISAAKALGIAQGSDGKFSPKDPLTRQDAMVLLNRTLEKTGRTLTSVNSSYLTRFRDGSSVASYAQSAVATLANAGVIQGDNNGNVNPTGTLTRAEMAVILHRVLTL